MKTEEQKQFVIMQQDITNLKDDVREIKGDVKTLIDNLDQRFMDMANHNASEIVKATMEFQKELDKKADVDKSWGETVWILVFRTIGAGVIGTIGYAIFHAYTAK